MFHPIVRLLLWGTTAVGVQFAAGWPLASAALGITILALNIASQRLTRLLRRARWLFVAIAALFAWSTPGVLWWPEFGGLSPTVDGLILATAHLSRLLIVLATLALLLETTSTAELVGAVYSLMASARCFGLEHSRFAVRLMLVLEIAQSSTAANWREWLASPRGAHRRTLALTLVPLGGIDRVAMAALLLVVLGVVFLA